MTEAAAEDDVTVATAPELANLLGVTARRVQQLAGDGQLIRRSRGLYDATHAVHAEVGRLLLPESAARDPMLAAVTGWLYGHRRGRGVQRESMRGFYEMTAPRGLERVEVTNVLVRALGHLGDRVLHFRKGARIG